MLLGLEFWDFHQYLFSSQLWWCIFSWSASPPTGGQGYYAALFSLYVHTWANLEDLVQALKGSTPGITISVYLWMIPGDPEIVCEEGRSDFDALYVFTNSCPLGKRLKSVSTGDCHINSLQFLVSVVSWLRVLLTFQTFCIRKELCCYLSKHQAETHPQDDLDVPPLPTFYWF